jgi:hypothetical protein
MAYADFKTQMLTRTTGLDIDSSGDFDCVDIAKAYAQNLFPGVGWVTLVGYGNAKDLWGRINENYFTKIPNDPKDANQLPLPGDIMVFDKTPIAGYSNQFDNPYGHVGVCDTADKSGYNLLQQASGTGKKPWIGYAQWNYRKCLGWYRPKVINQPAPQPTGGNNMGATREQVEKYFMLLRGDKGDQGGVDHYVGKEHAYILDSMDGSQEVKDRKILKIWEYNDLVAKANKPPVEVVKEVIKEVPGATQPDPDGQKWRDLKKLKALEKELSA